MPKGAKIEINGLWYKIGDLNHIYFHNGEEWRKSTMTKSEYNREIIKQRRSRR
jgi:hypothetical protein